MTGQLCNYLVRFPINAGPRDNITVQFTYMLNTVVVFATGNNFATSTGNNYPKP